LGETNPRTFSVAKTGSENMSLFDSTGTEVKLTELTEGSIVIATVKNADDARVQAVAKSNEYLDKEFRKRAITLIWSSDWIEFTEFKEKK
jgi:hypothetical protein